MPAILLLGYFGARNFGDDALFIDWLQRHSEGLARRGLTVHAVCNGADPFAEFTEGEALRPLVSALIPKADALKLDPRAYTALVAPGGSLLQDATSLKSLLFYLYVIRRFNRAGKPVYLLNQGLGPFTTWLGRMLTPRYLSRARLLSLRDEESYNWAQRQGPLMRHPNLLLAADPILDSALAPAPGLAGTLHAEAGYALTIAKPTGDLPTPLDKLSEAEALARLVDTCYRATGLKQYLLPLHGSVDEDFAAAVCKESQVGSEILRHQHGPRGTMIVSAIAGARLVISYRLHGLVLAAARGVPCLGVAYDPKVTAFCDEIATPYCFPATVHEADTAEDLTRLWQNREEILKENTQNIARLKARLSVAEAMLEQLW